MGLSRSGVQTDLAHVCLDWGALARAAWLAGCCEQLWCIQGHVPPSGGCFWSASLITAGLFAVWLPSLRCTRREDLKETSCHWKQKLLPTEVWMFCGLFSPLTQNIYSLEYGAWCIKLHCPIHVCGMGIEMGLEWAKEKEQTGKCPLLGQGTSAGDIYCWGQLGLCLSPRIQGMLQLPPAPWKSCSPTKVAVLLWFSVQWHMIYELCSVIYDLYGWQRKQDQALGYCANRDDT